MQTFNISARRVAPLSPMLLPVRFSFLMAASPAVHLTAVLAHTHQHAFAWRQVALHLATNISRRM